MTAEERAVQCTLFDYAPSRARQRSRREFVRNEDEAWIRFMFADGPAAALVSTARFYRCDCGFVTGSAGAIFDHVCRAALLGERDG